MSNENGRATSGALLPDHIADALAVDALAAGGWPMDMNGWAVAAAPLDAAAVAAAEMLRAYPQLAGDLFSDEAPHCGLGGSCNIPRRVLHIFRQAGGDAQALAKRPGFGTRSQQPVCTSMALSGEAQWEVAAKMAPRGMRGLATQRCRERRPWMSWRRASVLTGSATISTIASRRHCQPRRCTSQFESWRSLRPCVTAAKAEFRPLTRLFSLWGSILRFSSSFPFSSGMASGTRGGFFVVPHARGRNRSRRHCEASGTSVLSLALLRRKRTEISRPSSVWPCESARSHARSDAP